MTSLLYRTITMITPVCRQTLPALLFCMVFYYLIHFGKEKEFIGTFSFIPCVLLTSSGLKLMGARDYLSVLVHTFSARLKIH